MELSIMIWLNTLVLLGATVTQAILLYRILHTRRPEPDREF